MLSITTEMSKGIRRAVAKSVVHILSPATLKKLHWEILALKKGELMRTMLIWKCHLLRGRGHDSGHGGRREGQTKQNRLKSKFAFIVNTG